MEMEVEEIKALLKKICGLHYKLSDTTLSISRSHFLCSVNHAMKSGNDELFYDAFDNNNCNGSVFYKDVRVDDNESAILDAKSLNSIRTALENLEDQLDFFHTVQIQERAERNAAIAPLKHWLNTMARNTKSLKKPLLLLGPYIMLAATKPEIL